MLSKKVNQRSVDIVNGYIKCAQLLLPYRQNPYYNIPEIVNQICINFYNNPEYFTKYNSDVIQLNDDKTMIIMPDGMFFGNGTSYGNVDIIDDNRLKYIWKFKIKSCSYHTLMAIGIDSSSKAYVYEDFHDCDNKYPYYAFEIYSSSEEGVLYEYDQGSTNVCVDYGDCGEEIHSIDEATVMMELNLKDKTLKYYINDIDQGVAFTNIYFDQDTIYNMAVYVNSVNIELIDFLQDLA